MTSAAAGRGGLGWAILALALAVPGMLFYNWWSSLKSEREKAVEAKAQSRMPPGGVFSTPPPDAAAGKLVNPIATTTAPAAAVDASTAAAAAPVAGGGPAASAADAPPAPAEVAPPVASTPLPGAAAAPTAAAAAPVITLKRDPMLSPGDVVRLQQEELERKLAEEALRKERDRKNRPAAAKRAPPPETLLELMGIVESPDGDNRAIVNNEVVGVGEVIAGCRVVKITGTGVVFEHKGRRFVKNVSRD